MVIVLRKKWILAGLLCLLLLAAVPGIFHHVTDASVAASASANTNWGLSFQEEGKTPVGNASAASLKQYDAYYAGDPSQKTIYLTFDAGYENGYTPAILDTLKKHNVKAAFFCGWKILLRPAPTWSNGWSQRGTLLETIRTIIRICRRFLQWKILRKK